MVGANHNKLPPTHRLTNPEFGSHTCHPFLSSSLVTPVGCAAAVASVRVWRNKNGYSNKLSFILSRCCQSLGENMADLLFDHWYFLRLYFISPFVLLAIPVLFHFNYIPQLARAAIVLCTQCCVPACSGLPRQEVWQTTLGRDYCLLLPPPTPAQHAKC